MKKILSLLGLMLISLSMFGCGCNKESDNSSTKNKDDKTSIPVNVELKEDSRKEKEFEKIEDKLSFYLVQGDIKYTMIVYFESDKAINGVVQMVCPNEKSATEMYSIHRYDEMYDDVVKDGLMVSYNFPEKNFAYKNMSKEDLTMSLLGQGYQLVK